MKNRPDLLYKYKPVSEGKSFNIHEIYFADPKNDFNDPYDCYFHLILDHPSLDENIKNYLNALQQFGIFSLTRYQNEMLMWSHYADNHKGVCIGYKVDALEYCDESKHPGGLRQVKYVKPNGNETIENIVQSTNNLMSHLTSSKICNRDIFIQLINLLFLKKSESWLYEGEWRITWFLKNINGPINNNILNKVDRIRRIDPRNSIDSITFGAKMPDKTKNIIYDCIHKQYPNIKFMAAELSNTVYEIKIKDFKCN